ncbi:MAG: hypothetical protein ABIO70_29720 [Pseudomonadota bacterium]
MRRALLPLLLFVLPTSAHAVGFGTSYGHGVEQSVRQYYVSPFLAYPTLDLYLQDMVLQLHPFELLQGFFHDDLLLGGDLYFQGWAWGAGGALHGVAVPGASLDITPDADFRPFNLEAMGQARVGLEGGDAFRYGAYIVPGLGLALADGDFDLALGGRLEVSVWVP